jgi:hypothetical protein
MQICKRGITGLCTDPIFCVHFWCQLCPFCLELAPFAFAADLSPVSCRGELFAQTDFELRFPIIVAVAQHFYIVLSLSAFSHSFRV